MTPALGAVAIAYLVVVGVALGYRRRSLSWETRANHWFSVAMRQEPLISEQQAVRLMDDLFPSVTGEVERLRDWREQRALRSSDHTTLHHFPADSDREAVGHLLRASGGKPS